MKEKKYLVGVVALIILCVLGWFLYSNFKPETQEGNKKIDVVVVHGNKEEKTFHYETDVEYLGDVLTKEGLIEKKASTDFLSQRLMEKRQMIPNSNGGASHKMENK